MTTDWHTRIFDYLALAVTAYIALAYNWNANELCWGFWISSLLTGWIVIVSSGLRMLLTNITKKSSSKIKILGCTGSVLLTIFVAFHFSMFHMIHGLLMSVFIRIQPEELFGPNGLINSDLRLVVLQLIYAYWGIILGVLISRRENIFSGDPKKNLEKIYNPCYSNRMNGIYADRNLNKIKI